MTNWVKGLVGGCYFKQDIVLGNYIRWINLSNPENIKLTNGAIVSDFKELENMVRDVISRNLI